MCHADLLDGSVRAFATCAPTQPSITDALTLQRATAARPVVVTVYDSSYADFYTTFTAMCRKFDLLQIVSLALDFRAFALANGDPTVIYSSALSSYAGSKLVQQSRYDQKFHRVGRVRLVHMALVARAGYGPLMLEPDVLLFRSPLADLALVHADGYDVRHPACHATADGLASPPHALASAVDGVAFSCKHVRDTNARVNLGLQLYRSSPRVAGFLSEVALNATSKLAWDQGAFSKGLRSRKPSELRFCAIEMCWADSIFPATASQPLNTVLASRLLGAVHVAGSLRPLTPQGNEHGMLGFHMIGLRDKVGWMASSLVFDPHPAATSGRSGYAIIMTPPLASVEVPYVSAEDRVAVTALTLAVGALLHRTPVISIVPPRVFTADARQAHHTAPVPHGFRLLSEWDLRALRNCNGSFLPSTFLSRGHLFLNRSRVPRSVGWMDVAQLQALLQHGTLPQAHKASNHLLIVQLDDVLAAAGVQSAAAGPQRRPSHLTRLTTDLSSQLISPSGWSNLSISRWQAGLREAIDALPLSLRGYLTAAKAAHRGALHPAGLCQR